MNKVAETFPPGDFLQEELEARGWSQSALAEIMGRPVRLINEIIAGKKGITPETAVQLGDSLGTGPEVWMNLESQYQLSKVRSTDGLIARRAKLYQRFPVREMTKRGWIEPSESIEVLETRFCEYFKLETLDADVEFRHAARKSASICEPTMLQYAWLYRARQLASELRVGGFSNSRLQGAMQSMAALMSAPEEARHVPKVLAECGVRFVIIEPIPGSKIDGACFWLAENQPVIALSMRLDRIDNFWFVLRHEVEHVLCGHGRAEGFVLDQDLEAAQSESASEVEAVANRAAAEFCVSRSELQGFIARVDPFYSDERVVLFARRIHVHPGIVVGQLQRHLHRYNLLRKHQVKIRSIVSASALTDGWGVVHAS